MPFMLRGCRLPPCGPSLSIICGYVQIPQSAQVTVWDRGYPSSIYLGSEGDKRRVQLLVTGGHGVYLRAHHQAGRTCHIVSAVIRRLPLQQTQAMRALLLRCHPRRCVRHRDGGKRTHISHTLSSCITPGPHRAFTISPVMPQPKDPQVAFQSCPPQQ